MYAQLLKRIKQPTTDYYNILIDHKHDILQRVKIHGQTTTAHELGMSQTTLSNHLKLLNALEGREHRRYNLYYVTYDNACKIGITSDIANRLTKFSKCDTIETWAMDKELAIEVEETIKAKYQSKSFYTTYPRRGEIVDIPDGIYNRQLYHVAIQCAKEVFLDNILTKADRLYLDSICRG